MTAGRRAARAAVFCALVSTGVLATEPQPPSRRVEDVRLIRQARAVYAAPVLAARLEALGRRFDGQVGIAVSDVEQGWTAAYNGDAKLPQQSVSKLWVVLAILDSVDRGELSLDDRITVRKQDLSIFHQPLRKFVGASGYDTTVRELLAGAIQQSDNAANDVLLAQVGGPDRVRAVLARHRIGGITPSPSEKVMQTEAAGLTWRDEFSFGRNFWTARDELPLEFRAVALESYLANPPDAATAVGLSEALARLKRGELLSRASTDLMIELMTGTVTGPARLPAGLPADWQIAHKTGTGQVFGPVATGFNDVALITAPDGQTYAVVVMIAQTRLGVPERQAFMAQVAREVVAQHERDQIRVTPGFNP